MKELTTLLLVTVAASSCGERPATGSPQTAQPQQATARHAVIAQQTQQIRIPTYRLTADNVDKPPNPPGALTIRPEAEDQQAEGPQSFVVLDDGRFVIADPLRERLAVYSAAGTFEREIKLDAAPSEVALEGGRLRVTIATDSTVRTIDIEGRLVLAGADTGFEPPEPDVVLDSERSGVIRWKGGLGPASEASGVRVQLDDPNVRLASLDVVAGGPNGTVYVAAESAERSGRSLATVATTIRRYSAGNELQVEVQNIPLDYYVTPTTPFRVVGNTLYQLYPQLDAVVIHVWKLP